MAASVAPVADSNVATHGPPVALAAHRSPSRTCCGGARAQDQVWLVSSRHLSCSHEVAELRYWYYVECSGWMESDATAFAASGDPSVRTVVWLHGNRIESSEAFGIGTTVYHSLTRQLPTDRPIRFVIWSWPSERVGGAIEDARVKAARTNPNAHYLAQFVAQMDPSTPITLIGYSFGARVITGSLHLLGGGSVSGEPLAITLPQRTLGIRAVLIAPAIDNDWLLPGRRHGLALSQVESMMLMINSCDKVLKRYHLLYCGARKRNGPQALGYTGLVGGGRLGEDRLKIEQTDACCAAGPEHYWRNYFNSPSLVVRMEPYVQ